DEIETQIDYSYAGSEPLPSAVFPIAYDRDALVPLGGGGEPLAIVSPAPNGAAPADGANPPDTAAAPAPPPAPAPAGGDAAAVPAGLSATATGLVWNAGRIEPSLFGRTYAGNGATSIYTWFYDSVYVPMQSTMFALLAFFISSAAFRAFRLRSTHAVLLGVTALVVILGSVPVGQALWTDFPTLVAWVMNCLQTAGKRAILIG